MNHRERNRISPIMNEPQSQNRVRLSALWMTVFATLAILVALTNRAASQEVVERAVFTVGTVAQDVANRDWAYLLWQPTEPELIAEKSFAVYAKPGDAASASDYERKGIVYLQTDPNVIQILLNRGAMIGDDLNKLEQRIDALFLSILPDPSISLPEKLSAVIRGSTGDLEQFANLILLGRLHPSVNFCVGLGFTGQIDPGKTTFEIREFSKDNGNDLRVLGRVTVEAGNPTVLPAPGAPVQVPEANAKGDLNVKLRWSTSANLRRLSLLSYGFNVYRMTKDFAEDEGYDMTPPTPEQIGLLAAGNASVKRINELPVLKARDFSAADVGDFVADPKTIFVADDNGRYRDGGVAFEDGEQFYYFTTARDVLGRDGLVSPGSLVTICDRLPSDAPGDISVVNDYSYDGANAKQVLKVRWRQHTDLEQDTVVSYYVYRWASPTEVQVNGANPVINRIAGPIAHDDGQEFASYVDDGAGSPQAPADYGKTIWYTVRAVDDGSCDGGNFSPNSRPAFGVLRDRTGPAAPGGRINIQCCKPILTGLTPDDISDRDCTDQNISCYRLVASRENPTIRWAEFYIANVTDDANFIGRVFWSGNDDVVSMDWTVPTSVVAEGTTPFYCRVGTATGEVSNYVPVINTRSPKATTRRVLAWDAKLDCRTVPLSTAATGQDIDCNRHTPNPPGDGDDSVDGIDVVILLTPGTKEFKLYRRVDFGTLTLIKQGPADFDDASMIVVTDPDMPANAGTICYYGQLFDEHGNASPLVLLSDCVDVNVPTATPLLSPLEVTGDSANPKMKIKWFCPPYGVKRFEVSIANNIGTVVAEMSADFSPATAASPAIKQVSIHGNLETRTFGLYRTPIVGPAFGNGAMFEVTADISQGINYTVVVAAVGVDGSVNMDSNAEELLWSEPVPVGPDVPWPARPLPQLNVFHAKLIAERLPDFLYPGVGIRIGEFDREEYSRDDKEDTSVIFEGSTDPVEYLYKNTAGESLFPVVVYRLQLANPKFPVVSGDIIQVTPLMEEIAYSTQNLAGFGPEVVIQDPFILATRLSTGSNNAAAFGRIYLLDTQPVVENAWYTYLLVRLGENKEILEVIPTAPVEITP